MSILYPALCHFEDGGYWCEFPDLEGCFSQGGSEREIVENAKEALGGYVLSLLERGKTLPPEKRNASRMALQNGGERIHQFQQGFAGVLVPEARHFRQARLTEPPGAPTGKKKTARMGGYSHAKNIGV